MDLAIEGAKGFYDGYHLGLYKHSSSAMEKCLNKETTDNMEHLVEQVMDFEKLSQNMFSLMGEGTEIWQDLNACHFQDPALDVMSHCATTDNCGMPKMMANLQKNMFVLMGKMTAMGELFNEFPAKEPTEFHMQMKQLGDDIGQAVRLVIEFEPKK